MTVPTDSAKTLFLEALDRPETERAAFLDSACAGDASLRERVEALLQSHQRNDSFLDPRKLHPASGHTQTSEFDDTSTAGERATRGGERATRGQNPLEPWLQPSTQPQSLGRFRHYEVLEELGQGGFGVVYRVFDEKLHRVVALKVLSPILASNSEARQRFLREARAAAAVRHEHVISIHDVEDSPIPHLVMEFIHGQTLQSKIDKSGPLKLKEILRIGMQMAMGLEAAHRQGLIHRDIKPSNILLENGIERVKISDFGLARAVDDTSISHQGMIVGTPAFMSPEQAEGLPCDARSDLFSLGSTIHAMCTGQPPFAAASTLGMLKQVTEKEAAPVSKANPELPAWLDEIVGKLMAKAPSARYQSARDVSDVLANKLAEVQGPAVKPVSKRLRVWAIASTILMVLIVLAFTERWGLTRLTPPILKLFHHRLTLELPSRDTIVEIWMTEDTVDEFPKRKSIFGHGKLEPYVTVVNMLQQTVTLPPGNYYVQARLQSRRIEHRLIKVGWGGTSTIQIANPASEARKQTTLPVLLKCYDPKKDRFTSASLNSIKMSNQLDNSWVLESNNGDYGFTASLDPLVENLPREGIIACKARIKLTKRHIHCQGSLLINGLAPSDSGYDWPVQKFSFSENTSDYVEREVRYPASMLHKKNPPQLMVAVSLMAAGTIQVKDIEVWHLPGSDAAASASLVPDSIDTTPVLFKRFDPARDKPTGVRGDPATTVKVESDTWRLENNTHTGNYRFTFAPILQGLPRAGLIICKAKIKLQTKTETCWGNMQLDTFGPDHFGYNWPNQQYRYQGTVAEWTEKEVHYPAHAFWEKSPPQLAIEFGLHDDGVLYVKDLELWIIPGHEAPSSSKLQSLEDLHELAAKALEQSNERYRRGIVSYDEVVKDQIKCFELKVDQAKERQNPLEVRDFLQRIRDQHRILLSLANKRLEAGVITERDVINVREALFQADMRLKESTESKK